MPTIDRLQPLPTGTAAAADVSTAVALLGLLLALQACFTLLVLALRPYISAVLNAIELSTSCLELAILVLTMAAYQHTRGDIHMPRDSHLQVGGRLAGCNVAGRHGMQRLSQAEPSSPRP